MTHTPSFKSNIRLPKTTDNIDAGYVGSAQLKESSNGIQKVRGSNPLSSKKIENYSLFNFSYSP